jgi:formylglycine-generating enzyme required for sulfatase activity
MSADIADKLRALARDHLEGRMSLQTYRHQRAQLLDGLAGPGARPAADATQPRRSAAPGEATRPRPAARREDVTQPRDLGPAAAAGRGEPAAGPSGTTTSGKDGGSSGAGGRVGRVIGYASLGLLLAGAAALLLWRHHSPTLSSPSTAAAGGGNTVGGAQADPIRALLEPMLAHPDWSDDRLLALNEALLEAGQARLDAVRNTDWFDAFVQSVRSRLREQQALAGAPLTPDSSPLAALAVTLGIDLSTSAQASAAAALQGGPGSPAPVPKGERPKAAQAAQAASTAPAEEEMAPAAAGGGHPGADSRSPAAAPAAGSSPASPMSARRHAAGKPAAPSAPPAAASQAAPAAAAAATAAGSTAASQAPGEAATHRQYPACSAALGQERLNYCQDFLASGEPAPLLAVIPRGSFMMGNAAVAQESPVHRVTLAYDFAMSVYEVSQSEFQLYCRKTGKVCPRQPWARADDPVVEVSWHDAQDYVHWLSRATHQQYRLPTEAEWEYAARAGRKGLYPSGNTLSPTDAYFSMDTTLTAPAPRSMQFNANAWHLMHMVGNAREWVEDAWNPTFAGAPVDGSARQHGETGMKVVRGGCYSDPAIRLRLTTREPLPADTRDRCTGIRLVREIR